MICTIVPIVVYCAVKFCGIPLNDYGSLAMSLMNWQPCLNPMISLYFVKPFRNGVLRLFRPAAVTSSTFDMPTATKSKNVNRKAITLGAQISMAKNIPPVS
ncbi:unnamed protein product [Gongylonema pulchrum]|uniref:G_PROTEIN_RECEP_F1_2 domain-containing protein n=1 Tax=Gongylonema pulchrum TaxID=637853 RepID=A0A183ESX6_9BILA|nr:unnamed protein product [Gongylonema pulchrum]